MIDIQQLRNSKLNVLAIGSHHAIIQSMLDFDYLCNKSESDLKAIIGTGRKYEKYFWGKKECLIPVYPDLSALPNLLLTNINCFINVSSGRRTLSSTLELLEKFSNIKLGVIFAENVPEKHSLEIEKMAHKKEVALIGPASVGFLIPNQVKIGAIGGVDYKQFSTAGILNTGNTAVMCSSGGMTNELISTLSRNNIGLSFALSFGGDRFPVLTPEEAFICAQHDSQTQSIVYFGELGGGDEYKIVDLIKSKKVTKPVIAYIAGSVSSVFEEPPQFGHAKALAKRGTETALAKADALKEAGVKVGKSFDEFIELIKSNIMTNSNHSRELEDLDDRHHSLFSVSISGDDNGTPTIFKTDLVQAARQMSYGEIIASILLGRKPKSKDTTEFIELILKLLVDHGPYVSGAVNTMITARAGKDLVSSLCSGLLTIGDRFGGAINESAKNWMSAVENKKPAFEFVEKFATEKNIIAGIGHKKYTSHNGDPRVKMVLEFSNKVLNKQHLEFALDVEKITLGKKANLILNVDGAVGAIMLDLLKEKEQMSQEEIRELVRIEFFNALFVLGRSVGFVGHYLDQKKLDEGLFRLPEDLVTIV